MSPTAKKSSRAGRYRKRLVAPMELSPVADGLQCLFQALDKPRGEGRLSDAEFLGYGLLALLACRRSDAFQSNGRALPGAEATEGDGSARFLCRDFWECIRASELPLQAYEPLFNQADTVSGLLSRIRFRGIPDSARWALIHWLQGRYPLVLLFHVPVADEVFSLQKRGERCVTLFTRADELTAWHQDRDAISFTVHDLIHAHEFYANPQRAGQQIGFYHWLEEIGECHALRELRRASPGFGEKWEYVRSDMNSYCGHLLKTLHASIVIHAKPGEGEGVWRALVEKASMAAEDKDLFLRINSPAWHAGDFLALERVFEGYRPRLQKLL